MSASDTPAPVRPQGVRIGVDVGAVRVGLAVSDPHGRVAVPLRTVARPRPPQHPATARRTTPARRTTTARAAPDRTTPSGTAPDRTAPDRTAPGGPGAPAGPHRPDLDEIAGLVAEREAVEVIVGLPRTLSGEEGQAARAAREYALALAARIHPVPVRLVDERLSTVTATRSLRAAGIDARRGRRVVDQAAAAVILQTALDAPETTQPLAPPATPASPDSPDATGGPGAGTRRSPT